MREYCFTVECDQQTLTTRYNSRELTFIVLGNPLLPATEDFIRAVGLWDNFSVAGGMNTKAWTTKSRPQLLLAAETLRNAIAADRELLRYDYQYGLSAIPKQRNSAKRGIGNVGGRGGLVAATPGQLYLELWEKGADGKGRIVEIRDLRKGQPVETDELGFIKVYRRKNTVDWEPKLGSLIAFLQGSTSGVVRIRHHYPELVPTCKGTTDLESRKCATMRKDLLTFNGAVEWDPAIDAWMKERAGELGAIAREWFEVMRKCGDEVREVLHEGCPTACLGDAPFGYVNVFTSHVNVGFFHGAALPDPARLLQGTGKFMRHVKLTPGTGTNAAALSRLIEAAYSDIKARVENG